MLSSVRYRNFKRYSDVNFNVSKPLTILVGPNSSGKSSLLKGLLAFKQTYGDTSDHAGFMSDGEYVDIGPFEEYAKDHSSKSEVGFIFAFDRPNKSLPAPLSAVSFERAYLSIIHTEDPQSKQGRMESYTVYFSSDESISLQNCETSDFFVKFSRMRTPDEAYRVEISEALFTLVYDSAKTMMEKKEEASEFYIRMSRRMRRGDWRAHRENQRGMIVDTPLFSDDTFIINIIQNFLVNPAHAQLFSATTKQLFALAGLRQKPTRSVRRTDESVNVGSSGQNTTSVYADLRHKYIKAGSRQSRARDVFSRLEHWLSRLTLAKGVEVGSWRDLVDMRTSSAMSGSDSVVDIGVGFSQAAPVLVQLAAMPEESMLLVEQPELHLFPRAQTELGQILCEEVARTTKRIVAETHSEHIIQGIQLHISNGRTQKTRKYLKSTDVQILYVNSDSSITELELDEYGEFITEWPQGFFDQTLSVYKTIFLNKTK